MTVQILIDDKTIDSPEWITVEFSPEEYFDYDYIEPDEKVEWDCVPEYDRAIDYLDIELDRISKTHLRIIDRDAQVTREIKTTFWNKGDNTFAECTEKGVGVDKSLNNWRLIISTKLQDEPALYEIMRFIKKEESIFLEAHWVFEIDENGNEIDLTVYPT